MPFSSHLSRLGSGILNTAAGAPTRSLRPARTQTRVGFKSVADRQTELRDFYDHFEDFVEMLCDAARLGATEKLARIYHQERAWFAGNYCGVRPFLISYLPGAPSEDAFEKLIRSETLEFFLQEDDGKMIHRIELSRYALSLYAEHLRQLVARNP